jgi:DNA/RNA-binding domain of Phe-tRNA-synthetase-like protein
MPRQTKVKQVEAAIETTRFIASTSLPISARALGSIADSINITFGDANRTMVTLQRFWDEMDGTKKDKETMERLVKAFGPNFYVDLES